MGRNDRAAMAAETVRLVEAGQYVSPSGRTVDIAPGVRAAITQTQHVRPEDWLAIETAASGLGGHAPPATVEVTGETTLAACRRLGGDVLALNFASAKNPGGGFLSGSQAQ